MNLATILDPVPVTEFFADYFENRPLHIERRDPDYFGELLTVAELDGVLGRHLLSLSDCRLAKAGVLVPPGEYTCTPSKGMRHVVDIDKVASLFAQGVSVIFDSVHRWHPALNAMTQRINTETGHGSQCNVYLTPPASHAFTAHFDTHDVLILQVHRSKR